MLAINKVLRGRYRIIQPLGQGAASAVYEAYDSERETNVALKEILIDLEKVSNISLREKIKHAFANQAKILAKVKHESLPQVRGYFAEVDRHYLIMELVDGTDVSEMLTNDGNPVTLSEITDWTDQLLDTLDYLHTLTPSIVHRDINPANVKLTSRGKIKLLGFNIANGADAEASMAVKSQSAAVINYLPLEQAVRVADQTSRKKLTDNYGDRLKKILKQPTDVQSDIYALGATIYHLITKQPPVSALERTLAVLSGKTDPLPTVHQINSEIPSEISDVLSAAMELERENRFDSASQMRQSLQTAVKKAQERMAEAAKNKEVAAAREAFLEEEKQLEKERQMIEQERQRIEEERRQQSELIERQLKEAEAQRIQAEQRAAEAEKRLSEKENQKPAEKPLPVNAKSPEADSGYSKSSRKSSVFGESQSLFAEAPPEKSSSWMMPVAALIFLVVGGMAAGIWFMRPSNAAESRSPIIEAPAVVINKTASEATVAAPPTVEKSPETAAAPTASASPEAIAVPVPQAAPKTKFVPPAPVQKSIKTPVAPVNKAPSNQKKPVTVDDLIGK